MVIMINKASRSYKLYSSIYSEKLTILGSVCGCMDCTHTYICSLVVPECSSTLLMASLL